MNLNLDHYEGTLITIGLTGISAMVYWFIQSKKKSDYYKMEL